MKQAVEVAHLVNGEVVSIRTLSVPDERRAGLGAAGIALAISAGVAIALGLALHVTHRAVHGPTFVALWCVLGLALAGHAARVARMRARRYAVGVDIDDDAYAPVPRDLVRRVGRDYELTLGAGCSGVVEAGRTVRDVAALVREGTAALPLGPAARAEISMGATTFVVRVLEREAEALPLPRGFSRPFVRRALVPIQLAALAAVLLAVPEAAPLGEADMKSAIPADATPWEVEKALRQEAQLQARTLHACFDTLPLTCQHAGYVGVGLSLSRQGEIRGSWIARSTYGRECPVEACMSNVISSWFFEPIPESMRLVLPVQVLRTEKPLPMHAALERPRGPAPFPERP